MRLPVFFLFKDGAQAQQFIFDEEGHDIGEMHFFLLTVREAGDVLTLHKRLAVVVYVAEYAGRSGKPVWRPPPKFKWNYARFAKAGAKAAEPDQTFEMRFAKDNAAEEGFNRWTINGVAYPMTSETAPAAFHLSEGKCYRIRMKNASDDIHPVHLHRHSFELTGLPGTRTAGILKDVMMLGGYQEAEIDFVADNPGLTLFHCHQQLHMDFGFMTLLDYV